MEVVDHHNFAERYTLSQVLFSISFTTRLQQIFLERLLVKAFKY